MIEFLSQMPTDTMLLLATAVLGFAALLIVRNGWSRRRDKRRCEYRFAYRSVFAWPVLRVLGLDCVSVGSVFCVSIWLLVAMVHECLANYVIPSLGWPLRAPRQRFATHEPHSLGRYR